MLQKAIQIYKKIALKGGACNLFFFWFYNACVGKQKLLSFKIGMFIIWFYDEFNMYSPHTICIL